MKQYNRFSLRPNAFIAFAIASTFLLSCNDASTTTDGDTTKTEIVVPDTIPVIDTTKALLMEGDSLSVPLDTQKLKKLRTRPETQNTSTSEQQ